MKLQVDWTNNISMEKWNDFVKIHNGTVFHTYEWSSMCEKHQNARLIRIQFLEKDELVAVLPIFLKRFTFIKVAASPMVVEDTPYLGPVIKDEVFLPDVMVGLEKFYKRYGVNFSRLIYQKKQQHECYSKLSYRHILRHTPILDLSYGKDKIWSDMEGRARTAIRKSEKSKIKIYFVTGSQYIDTYYSISEKLYYDQNKIPPNKKDFYIDLFSEKFDKHVKMIIAEVEGVVIGAAIIVIYNEIVYYLDGVSDKKYNEFNANSGIQWFVINWAIENGNKYYDFVGSDLPWIAKFKASFGGKVVEYSLMEKAMPEYLHNVREYYGNHLKPLWQRYKKWKHQ